MIDMILAAWERAYKRSVLASKKVDKREQSELYVLSPHGYAWLGTVVNFEWAAGEATDA